VASLSQGRTAAAQCGLFTHKSVPVIFEPPCISSNIRGTSLQMNSKDPEQLCDSSEKVPLFRPQAHRPCTCHVGK